MCEINYPIFSWWNMRQNQINILKTLLPHQSIIFKDINEHIFNFLCKEINKKTIKFKIFTIPDQWLIGEFELIK